MPSRICGKSDFRLHQRRQPGRRSDVQRSFVLAAQPGQSFVKHHVRRSFHFGGEQLHMGCPQDQSGTLLFLLWCLFNLYRISHLCTPNEGNWAYQTRRRVHTMPRQCTPSRMYLERAGTEPPTQFPNPGCSCPLMTIFNGVKEEGCRHSSPGKKEDTTTVRILTGACYQPYCSFLC